ncbi:MAG: hypothetical protein HOW97_17095 [Catenulispora sp.]|nr:hypothetical protein [Catenulispora sp.]
MTDLREVALAWSRHQALIVRSATERTAAAWSGLNPADLSGSWAAFAGPAMVRTVAAAQRFAAAGATAYVSAAVDAQGGDPASEAEVSATAFSGTAADGRSLGGLLYEPVIKAKMAIASGLPVLESLARAGSEVSMLVSTEVADAGREAAGAAMAATRSVHGYVRMVSGSACSRCIILAGRHYRWNASFLRHPRCACTGIPTIENRAKDLTTDPHEFFSRLSPAQQDARFGKADAQAIRDGADMNQVVNAHRGLYQTQVFGRDVQATTEGMSRRGLAGQRLAGSTKGLRLTVTQIYADAAGDRDLAISLLRRYGYLI